MDPKHLFSEIIAVGGKPHNVLGSSAPSEEDMVEWVKESSSAILSHIPETFWSRHGLLKPGPLCSLCPDKQRNKDSDNVLCVVLWSWCNPNFFNEIKGCLELGARQWITSESFGHLSWLRAYVLCIRISLIYAREQMELLLADDELMDGYKNLENMQESTNVLDAIALSQVLSSSTEWFRTLTTHEGFKTAITRFFAYLKNEKPRAKFHPPMNDLSVFSPSGSVTHVSVVDWFKNQVICPSLIKIMKLDAIKTLIQGITDVTGEDKRKMSDTEQLAACHKHAVVACNSLGINTSDEEDFVSARLLAFILIAEDIQRKVEPSTTTLSEEEAFRILGPALCDVMDDAKSTLKDLVEKQPPFVAHEFVYETVSYCLSGRGRRRSSRLSPAKKQGQGWGRDLSPAKQQQGLGRDGGMGKKQQGSERDKSEKERGRGGIERNDAPSKPLKKRHLSNVVTHKADGSASATLSKKLAQEIQPPENPPPNEKVAQEAAPPSKKKLTPSKKKHTKESKQNSKAKIAKVDKKSKKKGIKREAGAPSPKKTKVTKQRSESILAPAKNQKKENKNGRESGTETSKSRTPEANKAHAENNQMPNQAYVLYSKVKRDEMKKSDRKLKTKEMVSRKISSASTN